MKYWIGTGNGSDKIIVVDKNIIYKANPKAGELEARINELKNGMVPQQGFTGIPLQYLAEIKMQEGKRYIELVMKNSEEHLKVEDTVLKEEIFRYLVNNLPHAGFTKEKYSFIKAGKKPLIALAVITGLFLWTWPYAVDFDNGIDYETKNGRSLTSIIIAIASMGKNKVLSIFAGLGLIAIISFYFKAKNPPVVKKIKIR